MITSGDVFAKRKSGQLDEAYQMAIELVNANESDDWSFKAFAWCLIDLIKRESQLRNEQDLAYYANQLQSIKVEASDEILKTQIQYALSLCNPNGQLILQAKTLSKQGDHLQAANIYRQLCRAGAGDLNVQTSLGWELFRLLKQSLTQDNLNLINTKRLLADYLKLQAIEKPSLLHSNILNLAAKLGGNSSFSLLAFLMYWQLEYLRAEDYEPYINEKGEKYASLAEKVIQQAAKESVVSDSQQYINYIIPHLDNAIERFPDNIWLKLNKTKILLKLGRSDQALLFATEVTRSKVNDYWSWALLGQVNAELDESVAHSCYCKALLCYTDDKFTAKVRIKMAQSLASLGEFAEAKHEVERVLASKTKEGVKIPEDVEKLQTMEWYRTFTATESNKKYYQLHVAKAEALLFSGLPFIQACIGEKFTIPDRPNKPKIKLYLKLPDKSEPYEISVPENKHKFARIGYGVSIKGDFDASERFQVYLIEDRDCETQWDIFPEHIGVVDHVNHEKRVLHYIVNRLINGVLTLSETDGKFNEGDAVAVKVARYKNKQGLRYRVLTAHSTDKQPSPSVCRAFKQGVRESNGMGFTADDIFISRSLMLTHKIIDGDTVVGTAVLNYNKKKVCWGWKALSINVDATSVLNKKVVLESKKQSVNIETPSKPDEIIVPDWENLQEQASRYFQHNHNSDEEIEHHVDLLDDCLTEEQVEDEWVEQQRVKWQL
jgi:hypothetical protein